MGFHMEIARLTGEGALGEDGILTCLDRQPWLSRRPYDPSAPARVAARAEFLIFDPDSDPMDAGVGTLDVIGTPPPDGSYEAPWLAIRLGGGLRLLLRRALDRLLQLAGELDMRLVVNDQVVTTEGIDGVRELYLENDRYVTNLFGSIRRGGVR